MRLPPATADTRGVGDGPPSSRAGRRRASLVVWRQTGLDVVGRPYVPDSPSFGGRVISLTPAQYDSLRCLTPQPARDGLRLGDTAFETNARLSSPVCSPVSVADLVRCAARYVALTGTPNPAQLPALLFDACADPWPLTHYFPLVATQPDAQRAEQFARVRAVAVHPHLDLRLVGEHQRDLTAEMPASARWLAAGHLVEVLGERQDILAAFLSAPRHFRLYTSAAAFAHDGGVAGGDYDPARERVQLGLGRLFEGFGDQYPGVAPFLHEFGHMLDAFDAATGRMGHGTGLLPGLTPADGVLFDAAARQLFIAGKSLEARRYEAARVQRDRAPALAELPIGHPYVFQNDGEFLAGYLELFLRTPHRFARLNPDLYGAFSRLLRQDPRPTWPNDFAHYVRENEAAYQPGRPVGSPGITIPAA